MTFTSLLLCEMEHVTPNYGRAIFWREAGRKLRLKLVTEQCFSDALDDELVSQSLNWKPSNKSVRLAGLETAGQGTFLEMPDRAAKLTYLELHDDFQPGFFFAENKSLNDSITAQMSTVRFRDAEPAFE